MTALPRPFDISVLVVLMVLLLMLSVLSELASTVPLPVTVRFESELWPLSATVSAMLPAPSDSVPPLMVALERLTWAPSPEASTIPVCLVIGKTSRVVLLTAPSMVKLASGPNASSSPVFVTLLTMVTPCADVPSITPEFVMVWKPVLRIRPALTPLPMIFASLSSTRLGPIVPEPSMVLLTLVSVVANRKEKKGNGNRDGSPSMTLCELSLNWTTPSPVRRVLLAMTKSVA